MQRFHLCQILITQMSWKPDIVQGGGGGGVKISIDVNEQMPSIREFCRTEEIAGLIVLGSSVEAGLAGK